MAAPRGPRAGQNMKHGASRYRTRATWGRCRCEVCTEDHRARHAAEVADRARRLAADPTLAEHGKSATYSNWRCRCEPCSAANYATCHEYKVRTGRIRGTT